MLAREQTPQHLAALLDHAAEDEAVRPGEIDVLENAVLQRLFRRKAQRFHPRARDAKHFAGLDVAHVCGADQIERAGFRRHNPGAVELARARAGGNRADRASRTFRRASAPEENTRPPPD